MIPERDLHVDDGTLVRWLDDELADEERRAVEAHLAGCEACRASRESIATLSGAFRGWAEWAEPAGTPRSPDVEAILRAVDGGRAGEAPAPTGPEPTPAGRPAFDRSGPRRSPPGRVVGSILRAPVFRAAAVLVLLAGAALAFVPVTRWVEERVSGPETADVVVPAAPGEPDPGSMSVSFRPESRRLAIRVERRQAGERLRVEPAAGPEVEARVLGGDGGEELVVLPDGLAVRTPGPSRAEYVVAVPLTLDGIDLFVAGRRVWSGLPDALPMEWTLDPGADAPAGEGADR